MFIDRSGQPAGSPSGAIARYSMPDTPTAESTATNEILLAPSSTFHHTIHIGSRRNACGKPGSTFPACGQADTIHRSLERDAIAIAECARIRELGIGLCAKTSFAETFPSQL